MELIPSRRYCLGLLICNHRFNLHLLVRLLCSSTLLALLQQLAQPATAVAITGPPNDCTTATGTTTFIAQNVHIVTVFCHNGIYLIEFCHTKIIWSSHLQIIVSARNGVWLLISRTRVYSFWCQINWRCSPGLVLNQF